MKKLSNLGGLLVAAGILAVVAAVYLVGYDLRRFSSVPEYSLKEYTYEPSFDSLVITDRNTDITVEPSSDGKVHIICYENRTRKYYSSMLELNVGDTLYFGESIQKEWYDNFFDYEQQERFLKLLVPPDMYPNLSFIAENSDVTVSDIPCSNLEIITSNAKVTLENVWCDGDISVDSDDTSVNLNGITVCDVTVKTTNGAVYSSDLLSAGWTVIETDNADIRLAGINAQRSITVKTKNGNISGTVFGSIKNYDIKSVSERSNLTPSAYGNIPLILKAENGRVNVGFTDR